MGKLLDAKYVYGEDILIAYLDLCGTKFVYSKFVLKQQIERISQVISNVFVALDNFFGESKSSFYVHMYADSVIIAEKEKGVIKNCANKFLKLMLNVQYQVLNDSEFLEYKDKENDSKQRLFMPTLSRSLIKRGKYYGIITKVFQTNINDVFSNFSLIGGSSIVEMDDSLQGLPMGTYIDNSIVNELEIEGNRLIDVEGNQLKFIKPPSGFDDLRSIFSSNIKKRPEDIDIWGRRLIESTGNNSNFKSKLIPWIDTIQGRRHFINKSQSRCC